MTVRVGEDSFIMVSILGFKELSLASLSMGTNAAKPLQFHCKGEQDAWSWDSSHGKFVSAGSISVTPLSPSTFPGEEDLSCLAMVVLKLQWLFLLEEDGGGG